jgi:hypothetical protein
MQFQTSKLAPTSALLLFGSLLMTSLPSMAESFEEQVSEYIQKFPYQDTYNYAVSYTGSDPKKLNVWILGAEPALVKAGEDAVVRMNNDTYYKMAFMDLSVGPVVLSSANPSKNRFSSFQLMDDRNANFRNIIFPDGNYTLYYVDAPGEVLGEAVESPSPLAVVIVRVEVKDKTNPEDVAAAQDIFNGISIKGNQPAEFLELDLLSGFDETVAAEASKRMDEALAAVSFTETIVGPGQEPGIDVPVLNHAAGTKGGWGGPDPAHSAYEIILLDKNGEAMVGSNGTYTVTTPEPPVDAFWSITIYDTDRGGYFHPNADDRYHINNTSAIRNEDDTVTFLFKQTCEESDGNCLEVPAGRFDMTARYYLPHAEIISGEWTLPKIELVKD